MSLALHLSFFTSVERALTNQSSLLLMGICIVSIIWGAAGLFKVEDLGNKGYNLIWDSNGCLGFGYCCVAGIDPSSARYLSVRCSMFYS